MCEVFTYLGDNIEIEDKTENDIMDFVDILGNTITTIKIEERQGNTSDGLGNTCGSMLVKFLNGEENVLFTLEFNNWHNGYYPHSLNVNLYEGDSYEGLNIFSTCI